VKAQSSSTHPLQQRKAKIVDMKDVKAPLPVSSEPMHANNATARDAEFIYAVTNSKNGIPDLESYLPKIDDLNARHPDQGTALQAAVSENLTEKAQWLLEKGAHPDMEGGAAGTALKRAVANGNRAIIHLLFDFGANPNIEEGSDKGGSALEIAQPAIFDLLLSRGASPDTPQVMYTAITSHKLWMVEKLLAAGAEIEMRWHMYPYSPLNEAVHSGDQGILNFLLAQGADPNAAATGPGPNPSTFTPLKSAIYSNRFEQLRILLEHGADPYIGGFFQTAAGLGRTKTIKCLVEEIGMDTNNLDDVCKRTALIGATEHGRDETVRYLLSRKADIHIRAATGRTALQAGVEKMHSGCVRLLLDAGANAKDEGMLQDAVATGSLTNVKLLVSAGADVNAKSRKTGTPLEEAAKIGRTDMIEYLVSHGADVNGGKQSEKSPLWHAIEYQHDSSVKMLLGFGASTTGEDFLHCAARGGSIAVLQEILASGVDINLRDSKGRTAVEEAREKGFQDVVNFLRIHGAVVDKTDLDEKIAWRKG
jgi:ankyrin repeat protein